MINEHATYRGNATSLFPFSLCLVVPTYIIFVRNTPVTIRYEYTIYYHYDILMQDLDREDVEGRNQRNFHSHL